MVGGFGTTRSFLFLQGLATPFWVRLAREVERRGHDVRRINVCGGDRIFWPRRGAVEFRGRFRDWRTFLGSFLHDNAVTDIVLFGDCRPYHRIAMDLARTRNIAVHVFEEGYFRPDWVTLEEGGTNAYSDIPRDAETILNEAAQFIGPDAEPQPVGGGFSTRVRWELVNQVSTLLLAPFYPHYRRHRSHHPLSEMRGWIKRLAKRPFERRYTERLTNYLQEAQPAYYLLPLQLETDYQIRRHSPFKSMAHFMEVVLESFAHHAPRDARLVVKLHPLDNGLVDFRKQAKAITERLGMCDRVAVIDGGHLPTLLSRCEGVVIANSTSGLSALHHRKPVKALGRALFDIPGLTFQGPLDRFWTEKPAPDLDLFLAFRRVVLARAQINGSFFTPAGMDLAVKGAVAKMSVASAAGQTVRSTADPRRTDIAAAKPAVLVRH